MGFWAGVERGIDAIQARDTEREKTAFERSRLELADKRYDDERSYSRSRDSALDARSQAKTEYDRLRQEEEDKRYFDELGYGRSRDSLQDENSSRELRLKERAADRDELADTLALFGKLGYTPSSSAGQSDAGGKGVSPRQLFEYSVTLGVDSGDFLDFYNKNGVDATKFALDSTDSYRREHADDPSQMDPDYFKKITFIAAETEPITKDFLDRIGFDFEGSPPAVQKIIMGMARKGEAILLEPVTVGARTLEETAKLNSLVEGELKSLLSQRLVELQNTVSDPSLSKEQRAKAYTDLANLTKAEETGGQQGMVRAAGLLQDKAQSMLASVKDLAGDKPLLQIPPAAAYVVQGRIINNNDPTRLYSDSWSPDDLVFFRNRISTVKELRDQLDEEGFEPVPYDQVRPPIEKDPFTDTVTVAPPRLDDEELLTNSTSSDSGGGTGLTKDSPLTKDELVAAARGGAIPIGDTVWILNRHGVPGRFVMSKELYEYFLKDKR